MSVGKNRMLQAMVEQLLPSEPLWLRDDDLRYAGLCFGLPGLESSQEHAWYLKGRMVDTRNTIIKTGLRPVLSCLILTQHQYIPPIWGGFPTRVEIAERCNIAEVALFSYKT